VPKVEDMTGFAIDGPCRHLILFFGSRGRVIICSKCSRMWECAEPEFVEVDLSEDDKRVEGDG